MADEFDTAMRHDQPGSNADDPAADRLAAYPEAGELGSPQEGHDTGGDPGLPGHDQPAEGGRAQAEEDKSDDALRVDRLVR